ncbi:SAC3/GANP/Nin1/mts3/eIF-3 p25 family protein [Candida albicans]|uniref:Nuclear mRNA export factor n=1 Tax=Candida albicans TaxID=5476 RepID=A0A8H6BTX8_CANAX|nr:SAC3/GANP/Nin1/mts3/eIF-3 p25 family protein [Candida albicans]
MSSFGSSTIANGASSGNIFANQSNFGNFLGESQLNGNNQTNFKAASVFNNDNNNINTGSPEKNANTKKTQKQTNKTYQNGQSTSTTSKQISNLQCSKRTTNRSKINTEILFNQPKLLYTPEFVQNPWDQENQNKLTLMEAENGGRDYQGLYEDMQKLREIERTKMEELGLVDAENVAKDLTEAISFSGSCLDMCPVFERVRRQLENNVKALEKDPISNKISRERAVKAFSRPAAGQPPPLPSDVRPPHVLSQTLNYLVDNILQQLPEAHSFIWDRTRSIRQDFTYQNNFGPEAVDCNERIVRIHLLSLHIMAGSDVEYSQQQELEQFNKALQTLMEIYQDVRNNGGKSPNEAEFRAYHLLSHVRDPDLERQIQKLPDEVYNDKLVQLALRFRKITTQNNVVERGVTNLVETPFLMACLLETHFNEIRFYALKAISRSFHTKTKPYAIQRLQQVLGFDSVQKLQKFLGYYDIDIINVNGEVLVDLFNKEKLETTYKLNSFHEKAKYSPPYSTQLDDKVKGLDWKHFVNSGRPNTGVALNLQPPTFAISTSGSGSSTLSTTTSISPNLSKYRITLLKEYFQLQAGNSSTPGSIKPSNVNSISSATEPAKPQPVQSFNKPKKKVKPLEQPDTKVSIPAPVRTSLSVVPEKVKLTQSKMFPLALQQVFEQILQDTIKSELQVVLSKLLSKYHNELERKKVIHSLGSELYDAFLREVMYECVLEARAAQFYDSHLKKRKMKVIIRNSKKAVNKLREKKMKMYELKSVTFEKLKKNKRRLSISSFESNSSFSKRKRHDSFDVSVISEKQHEVHELWSPINLSEFLKNCSENLKLKIYQNNLDLKFLLIVENWRTSYAKWLNSKLGMPNKEQLNESFFANTAFILFECGLTISSVTSIQEKLQADGKILKKIISLIDKYSRYKVSIIISFWDVSGSSITSSEVADLLHLTQYSSVSNLKSLVLCDMTTKNGNINTILSQAFNKVSLEFNGELSSTGSKQESTPSASPKRKKVDDNRANTSLSQLQDLTAEIRRKYKK